MKGPGGLNGRVRRLERLAGTRRVCPAPHGRTVILKPGEAPDPDRPLPGSWHRWEQALEAYDSCEEAGNFQAVGGRLKECMVCFIGETATDNLAPAADGSYQAAEVKAWAGLRASTVSVLKRTPAHPLSLQDLGHAAASQADRQAVP